jgi:hypothetical protein
MTDAERAEHDRALREALLGPADPEALAAEIERESPAGARFRLPPRGLDPERLVEPKIESGDDRLVLHRAWAALGACTAEGGTPRAVLLDPEQWPDATGLLGLRIERREGLGRGVVRVAAEGGEQ